MSLELVLFKIFEFGLIPISFIALANFNYKKYGIQKSIFEFLKILIFCFLAEQLTIAIFHSHTYPTTYSIFIFNVPLVILLGWYAIITMTREIIYRLNVKKFIPKILLIAAIALNIDFIMDPLAIRIGLWDWNLIHHFFGVPFGNFLGWFFIVSLYLLFNEETKFSRKIKDKSLLIFYQVILPVVIGIVFGIFWTQLYFNRIITPLLTTTVIALSSLFIFVKGVYLHNEGLKHKMNDTIYDIPDLIFIFWHLSFLIYSMLLRNILLIGWSIFFIIVVSPYLIKTTFMRKKSIKKSEKK